jgi:hypothetical protein
MEINNKLKIVKIKNKINLRCLKIILRYLKL